MVSVIVAAPPFTGELQPLLQIAAALVRRGHDVTMITGSRFDAQVEATGARFAPLSGVADFDDRALADTFPEVTKVAPGPDQVNFLFGVLGDSIPDQHRLLQTLLHAEPDTVLVANSVFLGAWPVGLGGPGRRPRRWLGVGCNPLGISSADTTPSGPAPAGPTGDARSANRAANAQVQASLEPSRRRIEAAVHALGATDQVPSPFDGIVTVPDVFASLTVPGLEFDRSDAPASLHLVGALPAPLPDDFTPPTWWPELDAGRAVVVVTQGTLANSDLGQLVQPTLDALADENVLVVAALGGRTSADLPGTVPSNARVESFVPFGALLPRAAAFVTNGGFGATQQALAAGVPVVVAGTTEDKPLVAARVVAHGVGVDLATATPRPGQLRDAVRQVLASPSIRANVDRLADEYGRHDALVEVEHLALHGLTDLDARGILENVDDPAAGS